MGDWSSTAAVLALLRRESGLRWPDTRCDAVVARWMYWQSSFVGGER